MAGLAGSGFAVKVCRSIYDTNGDGFKETITLFKEGKACCQTEDRNRDGKPDIKFFFNAKKQKERVESDTQQFGTIWGSNLDYFI